MAEFLFIPLDRPANGLHGVASLLADAGVNIEAFSVDRDGVHLLTDQPGTALTNLRDNGHDPHGYQVVEVDLPDEPGQLARLAEALQDEGIEVRTAFGVTAPDRSRIYLRMSDADAGEAVLLRLGLRDD